MIINIEKIQTYEKDFGIEGTKELLNIFVEEQTLMKDEFFKAIDNKDYEYLKKLAHRAKSSVLAFGMDKLHAALDKFEKTDTKKIKYKKALAIAQRFEKDIITAIDEINSYLNRNKID